MFGWVSFLGVVATTLIINSNGGCSATKNTKDILQFSQPHGLFVLFCSLFEDILLTKCGEKIKKVKGHGLFSFLDLFCSLIFNHIRHKNLDFEGF